MLEREEGYFLGAMAINLVVAEVLVVVLGALVLVLTWPTRPWRVLQLAGPVAIGLMPALFFPWSRTLWLALDRTFRPPPRGDARLDHPRPGRVR